MPAGSTQAQAAVATDVDEVVAGGADPAVVGDDLFAVVAILDSEPALRRALTEPAVPAEAKSHLVTSLLGGKISEAATAVVSGAVHHRWSHGRDLADALEHAGYTAHLAQAERDGQLDAVEAELFRFERIADAEPRLRDALSDRLAPTALKRQLVASLLSGKVTEPTRRLVEQAVSGRERSFAAAIEALQRAAAARRDRFVATVRVASPLTADQDRRLAEALERQYGHPVQLNVIVDPRVLGGVRVNIGDDVIDSTVAARVADARRRLAG